MIFHRLAVLRIIEYFGLTDLFNAAKQKSGNKAEIKLKMNPKMILLISVMMSILGTLICVTLPFAIIESPTQSILTDWPGISHILLWIEKHLAFIDRIIVATSIILVLLTANTIVDAIQNTNIKIRPWVLKGKCLSRKRIAEMLRQNKLKTMNALRKFPN